MERKSLRTFFCSILVIVFAAGCQPQIVAPALTLGNLYVHPYISFGDGYSAGFSNGDLSPVSTKGLYEEAQVYAFPNLIAGQFSSVSKLKFGQHLIHGVGSGYRRIAELNEPICEAQGWQPVITDTLQGTSWQYSGDDVSDIHNFSFPHLRMSLVDSDSFGRNNPFFQSMAASNQSDYLDLIEQERPAFFTLWLGTEDVLDYGMSGTANPQFRPTPPPIFAQKLDLLLTQLESNAVQGLRGAIGNVPDITQFPFFSKVPHTYISIENCFSTERPIYLTQNNGINGEVRIASPSDKILMSVEQEIGSENGLPGTQGLHPENPLLDARVLDSQEVREIRSLITRYNAIIDSVVEVHNAAKIEPSLVVVDLHQSFENLVPGLVEDGLTLSTEYLTGGVFSLDGVYLTPRGNAFVANEFIRRINTFPEFRASVPTLNLTDFSGVEFP